MDIFERERLDVGMGMESVDNRNGAKKNIVTAKNFQLIGQGNWITLYLSCYLIDTAFARTSSY